MSKKNKKLEKALIDCQKKKAKLVQEKKQLEKELMKYKQPVSPNEINTKIIQCKGCGKQGTISANDDISKLTCPDCGSNAILPM
jgi:predicted RNA-binding Zn-ribbon protein involved in translation (DUF1610 family)